MSVILRATDNFGNKQDLDILDEGGLFCDVSAIESTDIGQLYGVSSKEFMLPGTDKNNQFFGNLYDVGSDPSVALNHTIYCSVLVDGQEGFEGRLYLTDIVTDNKGYVMYKAVVVNETVDFKNRIKDYSLRDLDLSEYLHALTVNNVTGSWYDELFDGDIVYPLVDYGTSDPETTISTNYGIRSGSFAHEGSPLGVEHLKPAVRVKKLVDKIFDLVDYQYTSSFFESDYFNELYMLTTPDENAGIPNKSPNIDVARATFKGGSEQTIGDGDTDTILWPIEVTDNDDRYTPGTGTYTVGFDGNYDIYLNLDLLWGSSPGAGQQYEAFVEIQVNGTTVQSKTQYTRTNRARVSLSRTLLNLQVGDLVKVRLRNREVRINTGLPVTGDDVEVQTYKSCELIVRPSQALNTTVDVSSFFPYETKVSDFLQGLIEQFNLIIEPSQDERKVLTIEPFNTWRDNGATKDWSDKVDHSVRKAIRGTMVDNPHVVTFGNEEDSDYLNDFNQKSYGKTFGMAIYTSDSDLTDGTREIGTFFAPTPIAAIAGTESEVIPHIYENSDGQKKPFKFKPRLLYNAGRRTIDEIPAYDTSNARDGVGFYLSSVARDITRKVTAYGVFHYLELDFTNNVEVADLNTTRDLNFNNTQQFHYVNEALQNQYYAKRDSIYEYWAQYLNDLYHPESKLVTMNLMFTPDEIKTIQLNDKIFIDGHYYRIDKISNFDLLNEQSTQVTLLKAPVRKFNFPVRRIYNIDGANNGSTGTGFGGAGGGFTDITVDPTSELNPDGSVTYVYVDDLNAVTGSGNQGLVGRGASLDGYTYIANDSGSAIWNSVPTQPTVYRDTQTNQGNNNVSYAAKSITTQGSGNVVQNNSNVVNVQGSDNLIQDNVGFANVQGTGNTVESFAENGSIISSTDSTITSYTQLGTIISGEDTIISGSNKSIAIGQDLTVQGGNSNVVIGNLDTQNKTVKDLINTTVINLNKDIESIENTDGDHYSGIAHIGTMNNVGAVYRDYAVITGSAGSSTDLSASPYGDAYYIHLTWQGGNGTHTLNLPSTAKDPLARDGNGYKRELRFFSDSTLSNNHKFRIQPSGSDVIDGTTFDESLDRSFDGITIFGTPGQWFTVQRKSK